MPVFTWLKRHLVVIAGLITLGYMLLPNIVVTVFSFNNPKGRFNYAWQEFSLDAWRDPCGVAGMCDSLAISLQIAAWATLGATVLGTLIAFALVRGLGPDRELARDERVMQAFFVVPAARRGGWVAGSPWM